MTDQHRREAGYSDRIDDPAFKRYLKHTRQWSLYFALGLAVIACAGFYLYGETSAEMDNPEALYIGMGIGGLFVFIALLQVIGRSRSRTWDGVVVAKRIQDRRRRKYTTGNAYYWQDYKVFEVVIDKGMERSHVLRAEDDDTMYRYYQVGDRVRHHAGLNSFEKYDKSKDDIIFCNACASLNQIGDDVCHRCRCPLLT